MKCLSLKHSESETKILALDNTRARIDPMIRSHRWLFMGQAPKCPPSPRAYHWVTRICHNSHNTQASLHIINPQAKLEQLKLSKTVPLMWP
jgi:hypothetical protein